VIVLKIEMSLIHQYRFYFAFDSFSISFKFMSNICSRVDTDIGTEIWI
jgi:hypothetical protein